MLRVGLMRFEHEIEHTQIQQVRRKIGVGLSRVRDLDGNPFHFLLDALCHIPVRFV